MIRLDGMRRIPGDMRGSDWIKQGQDNLNTNKIRRVNVRQVSSGPIDSKPLNQ